MLDYSQFFTKVLFQGGQIDPIIGSWVVILAASFCAFMIGRSSNRISRENVVESVLEYLINNNFIRAKKVDGEWEILDLDEK